MNCIRSFTTLEEQRQLPYEPACQKDTKEMKRIRSDGCNRILPSLVFLFYLYKGRQIPEFRVSLGQS